MTQLSRVGDGRVMLRRRPLQEPGEIASDVTAGGINTDRIPKELTAFLERVVRGVTQAAPFDLFQRYKHFAGLQIVDRSRAQCRHEVRIEEPAGAPQCRRREEPTLCVGRQLLQPARRHDRVPTRSSSRVPRNGTETATAFPRRIEVVKLPAELPRPCARCTAPPNSRTMAPRCRTRSYGRWAPTRCCQLPLRVLRSYRKRDVSD